MRNHVKPFGYFFFVVKIDPSKIRDLRKRAGLKTAEFAALIGVSRPYVTMIEKGKKPYLDDAKAAILCEKLSCKVTDLVTQEPQAPATEDHLRESIDLAGSSKGPMKSPAVERLPDGSICYHFVRMWTDENLKEILPAAEAAEDWDLVESIAAELRRRYPRRAALAASKPKPKGAK